MRLVQIGSQTTVNADRVDGFSHRSGEVRVFVGGAAEPFTVSGSLKSVTAALAPATPEPVRAIHPLALAYLEAERLVYQSLASGRLPASGPAFAKWTDAGCPIWAEP